MMDNWSSTKGQVVELVSDLLPFESDCPTFELWDSVTDHVCLCGMWTITELCSAEEICVTIISDKYSFYGFKSPYCGQILLTKANSGWGCLQGGSPETPLKIT